MQIYVSREFTYFCCAKYLFIWLLNFYAEEFGNKIIPNNIHFDCIMFHYK